MPALKMPVEFISANEYLHRERVSEGKHEYVNGLVYSMAGGSVSHNRLCHNMGFLLRRGLGTRPCDVFSSDMKVRIDKANVFRYPDISGLCGPMIHHDDEKDAYCNPTLIIEVLSPSTEALDRGEKFHLYRLLDSLVEYVLVSQERIRLERFRRVDGQWSAVVFDAAEDEIELLSLGVRFSLGELYERVEFEE